MSSCLNCKTRLSGPFCSKCGQRVGPIKPKFWQILSTMIAENMTFDSRMGRTVIPFLLRPGHLTKEFNRGRRVRYSSPLRLYLLTSVVLFMTLGLVVQLEHMTSFETAVPKNLAEAEAMSGAVEKLAHVSIDLEDTETDVRGEVQTYFEGFLALDTEFANWIRERLEQLDDMDRKEKFNVGLGVVKQMLPTVMFALLPILALILRVAFIGSGMVFAEHLVFSLQGHAMAYLVLLVLIPINHILGAVSGVAYLLAYYFVGLHRAFELSWFGAVVRGSLALVLYLAVLASAFCLTYLLLLMTRQ